VPKPIGRVEKEYSHVDRHIELTDRLYAYLQAQSLRETPLQVELREETAQLPMSAMQISPEQGQFMALLARLMGAKRYLELGTFTGYSALTMALALPDDGEIVACDVSVDFTEIARRYWAESGVAHKIDLQIRPALETLDALLKKGEADSFDFAFVDADKGNHDAYYEFCLKLVRPGGLIAVDNVLWGGAVADPDIDDADTAAIRALNGKLKDDERVDLSLLPVGDGLSLARKR